MSARGPVLTLCLALLAAAPAPAQDSETTAARRLRAAAPARASQSAQTEALLRQLADAQRALGEQMQQLREAVDAVHGALAERADQDDGIDLDVKALRDEVKGLYVENSTLKQQMDSLAEDVGSVNSNVSAFRTFSGFFLAVMILLLTVIFVLTIRR
jgi:septal ring factor EnvC (AmiA/AmiB activator)